MKLLQFLLCNLITLTNGAICREGVAPVCGEEFGAYNRTFFPNLLGQWSHNEISYTASLLYPLRAVGCSEHLDLFLCSVLSPACVDENPVGVLPFLIPVPPCQSLCDKVFDDCIDSIEEFGIDIPSEMLICDNFPKQYEDHPCVPIQSEKDPLPSGTLRWIEAQAIEDETPSELFDYQCPTTAAGQMESTQGHFAGIENCDRPCEPIELNQTQTAIFRLILAVFSLLAAIASSTAILIFFRDRKRFIYPERPTLYFAVCYLVISICFLVGLISPGDYSCANNGHTDEEETGHGAWRTSLISGSSSISCTTLFSIVYFFSCAAFSWWLVTILIWGFSIIFEWNISTVEKNGNYIHIFAWSPPAILTLLAAHNEKMEGEPMLGICVLDNSVSSLYYFQLIPVVLSTVVGITVFLIGLRKLMQIRGDFYVTSTFKLEKFLIRIVGFSMIFIFARILDLLLRMYLTTRRQAHEETWYHDVCEEYGLPCPQVIESPNEYVHPLLLTTKYILPILPSLAPLVWIINGKSLRGWGIPSNISDTTSEESYNQTSEKLSNSQNSRTDSSLLS